MRRGSRYTDALGAHCARPAKLLACQIEEEKALANWSLCGRHVGPGKPPSPIFINLDNVLTVAREGDLTTVVMVGGEKVYIDTSKPDEYAWRLQCAQRSYLVKLIPHRAAKVERVGQ